MIKISKKEDMNTTWQEFIDSRLNMISLNNPGENLYRALLISDELLEELSGKPVQNKLGEEWEDTARCPLCGEYLFLIRRKQSGIAKYNSNGEEEYISNLEPQVNYKRCKCGVKIIID